MAAYFGGQYYHAFDFHRRAIRDFYAPESSIDFDGNLVMGEDAIASMYVNYGDCRHSVTALTSFAEPITGRLIVTFLGDYFVSGQQRIFNETFILEETVAGKRIIFSLFRSFVEPAAADLLGPPADPLVLPAGLLLPQAPEDGTTAPSNGQGKGSSGALHVDLGSSIGSSQ